MRCVTAAPCADPLRVHICQNGHSVPFKILRTYYIFLLGSERVVFSRCSGPGAFPRDLIHEEKVIFSACVRPIKCIHPECFFKALVDGTLFLRPTRGGHGWATDPSTFPHCLRKKNGKKKHFKGILCKIFEFCSTYFV